MMTVTMPWWDAVVGAACTLIVGVHLGWSIRDRYWK